MSAARNVSISIHTDFSEGLPFSIRVRIPKADAQKLQDQLNAFGNETSTTNAKNNEIYIDIKPNVKLHRIFGSLDPLVRVSPTAQKDHLKKLEKSVATQIAHGGPNATGLSFVQGLETLFQALKNQGYTFELEKGFLTAMDGAINMYLNLYNMELGTIKEEKSAIDPEVDAAQVLDELADAHRQIHSNVVDRYLKERKSGVEHDAQQSTLQNTIATISDIGGLPQLLNKYKVKPDAEAGNSKFFKSLAPATTVKKTTSSQAVPGKPAPSAIGGKGASQPKVPPIEIKASGKPSVQPSSSSSSIGTPASKHPSTVYGTSKPKEIIAPLLLNLAREICDNVRSLNAPKHWEIEKIAVLLKDVASEQVLLKIKANNQMASPTMKALALDKKTNDLRNGILQQFGSMLLESTDKQFLSEVVQATVAVLTFTPDEVKRIGDFAAVPEKPSKDKDDYETLLETITQLNLHKIQQEPDKEAKKGPK